MENELRVRLFLSSLLFLAELCAAAEPRRFPVVGWHVVDGDTVRVDLDLGFDLRLVGWTCRVAAVDAPELIGAQRKAGLVVREAVTDWCRDNEPLVCELVGRDPYPRRFVGRVLGKGGDLGAHLIGCQLVHPYDGSRRMEWTPAELQRIEELESGGR